MAEILLTTDEQAKPPAPPTGGNQVPLGEKISWSMGAVTDQIIANGIGTLATPIYTIALGVNPALLGVALGIPRIFDAVIDPFIGNLSDNTRSRWGRRRPFIFVGTILSAIFFTLLWTPPLGLSHTGLFWYFMIASIFYYISYGIFVIPRYALGYELSTDYNERSTIMAWNSFIASGTVMVIPWLYKLSLLPIFGGREVIGVRYVAVMASIVILITGLAPIFTCKEKVQIRSQEKINLLAAVKLTLTNRPFLLMVGIGFFMTIGITIAGTMNLFINIYYVCGGDKSHGALYAGYAGTVQGLTGLVVAFPIAWLASRIGKKATLIVGLTLGMLGFLTSWLLFTPAHPVWQVIPIGLIAPGFACIYVLNGSILADICDVDELVSGLRREGMFGAVQALLGKSIGAAMSVVAGGILVIAGYKANQPLSVETVTRMRVLFAFVPSAILVVALALAAYFPITAQSAREVRAKLDARKAEQDRATIL